MPVIIYTTDGKQLVCRGERLSFLSRVALFFRFPVSAQAFTSEDRFWVPRRLVSYIQTMTDEVATRRRAEATEAAKKNPNPGAPAKIIPSTRR
jgi:hypothetical protein